MKGYNFMIPITKPKMTKLEIDYVNDAISFGWGTKCFEYIELFKKKLCDFFSISDVWLTTSCHGALHVTLMAIGVSPEDEIIVPDYTWVGSANPVKWLGGTVVGCDVDLENACIDVESFKKSITSKTKAVIVVHAYGNAANLDKIVKICNEKNIYLIEDCAGAFGSEYKGKKLGTIGDFGVFSFNATKMIITGEGGAIISKNKEFHNMLNLISDQGRDRNSTDTYAIKTLGLKYNMTNIQAALGVAQIERFEEILEKKHHIFNLYKSKFQNVDKFRLHNIVTDSNFNNLWLPTIIFNNECEYINDLVTFVNKQGANIRGSIYTLSKTEPYKNIGNFPTSDFISRNSISLCSYEEMSNTDVEYVSDTILKFN